MQQPENQDQETFQAPAEPRVEAYEPIPALQVPEAFAALAPGLHPAGVDYRDHRDVFVPAEPEELELDEAFDEAYEDPQADFDLPRGETLHPGLLTPAPTDLEGVYTNSRRLLNEVDTHIEMGSSMLLDFAEKTGGPFTKLFTDAEGTPLALVVAVNATDADLRVLHSRISALLADEQARKQGR